MTELEFAPPMDHFCMFCGMPNIVIDWTCGDCGHVICVSCKKDMDAVGKEPYCVWWMCKSNQHIKITVKEQFEAGCCKTV